MLTKNKKIALIWGSIHLLAILTGVFQLDWKIARKGTFGRVLDVYGRLTGAQAGFAFFSINVPNQLEIEYEMKEENKPWRRFKIEDEFSNEMNIRYHRMVRSIESKFLKPDHRRSLAASFAAYIFDRYPNAIEVGVIANIVITQNLRDYDLGPANKRTEVFKAVFTR